MPRLSIIVPALGPTTLLEAGLVAVLQHRPADCEVIVVLTGPYDDPYGLRDENVRFVTAAESASWLECVNRGLAVASGDIVHLLACGAEPAENWADHALRHFDDPAIAAVSPLVLDAERPDRILTAGVEFRPSGGVSRRWAGKRLTVSLQPSQTALGPSAVAAFYRAEALMQVGCEFDAAIGPHLADADIALRLRAAGYLAALEPASRVAACAEMLPSPAADACEQARYSERLYWRHLSRRQRLASLVRHVLLAVGETAWSLLTSHGFHTARGRLQGVADALWPRRIKPVEQRPRVASVAAELPDTVPIAAAQRQARQHRAASRRPLRRSA